MRQVNDRARIQRFMQEVGREARGSGSIYFVGGSSAVWFGWRETTIDIDLECAPEPLGFFSAIERIKRRLEINVELASPSYFVPALPNWQGRSEYIGSEGSVDFYHYDFYGQAYAKLSRGHERDLSDVDAMVRTGKVEPARLLELVRQRVDQIDSYPNLNRELLLQRLEAWAAHYVG